MAYMYMQIFLLKKMWELQKLLTFFFSKNTCKLDTVLTRTVNVLTTNELVKLTMLWTTGPWLLWNSNTRASGAYVALQTTLLHMKRLNKTESSNFVLLFVLFPKATL